MSYVEQQDEDVCVEMYECQFLFDVLASTCKSYADCLVCKRRNQLGGEGRGNLSGDCLQVVGNSERPGCKMGCTIFQEL